ncbi:membrane-associated protein, putative [Bodo saltans]|uniref:Membrane-associated protein, putative n=1 Tax=Bodo saltans TaxID=75058 RepID=A0A0S4JLQ6_BODSA|nr:membrane-associated protein, putative [Bodo saltans]|eukprot:CUG92465.1 membrane-associated protein, putative [Bodo saltans]
MLLKFALATALVCLVAAQAPNVLYQANPQPGKGSMIAATCPPTVVSFDSAFMCYHTNGQGDAVQYVNPATPQTQYPAGSDSNVSNRFLFPPIALSKMSALTYSADPANSVAMMYSSIAGSMKSWNRYGSTAGVAYAPDLQYAFIPVGITPRLGNYDTINAFDVTEPNEANMLKWSINFPLPTNFPLTTQLSTPIYYRGQLLVMAGKTFSVYNATTGQLVRSIANPCNWTTTSQVFQLYLITFGQDENGSLDAFIITGNTTTVGSGKSQFSVCRVSHNTGNMEWNYNYPNTELRVLDVTGSANTVLISAWFLSTTLPGAQEQLLMFSMNVVAGTHQGTLPRYPADEHSFPVVLPQTVDGCTETIVLQVNGKLSAYCTGSYSEAKWTSDFACAHRAALNASTASMACVSWGASVHLLDFDGNLIWINDQIAATFAAQIVNNIVWVVDLDSTLWGLSLQPSATPLPPPYIPVPVGDNGLSAGAVTGIVFTVLIVGIILGAAGVAYVRFSRRRNARVEALNEDNDHPVVRGSYGGIA